MDLKWNDTSANSVNFKYSEKNEKRTDLPNLNFHLN